MLFETALEQVAITEGLPLPRATEAPSDTTFTKADGWQLKPTPLSR
jgi:hypothetical protein